MVEIKLPEAKPAFEWVNGRALQKVSPKHKHALAQLRFATALDSWAQAMRAGSVGTEWRFHVQPPGEIRRPLVPDVAFLSYERLPYRQMLIVEEPTLAPDAVAEVRSPGDRQADIDEKVRVYLSAGAAVLFLVDPAKQTVDVCDAAGRRRIGKRGVVGMPHSRSLRWRLRCSSNCQNPDNAAKIEGRFFDRPS
jgi:Uma2 family endonuclease